MKKVKKPHILFSTDGKGNWNRREFALQCTERVFFGSRCQGVLGHKGVHWHFNASGSFMYDDNENDSTENGCSGMIPPDHKDSRTPLEMQKEYYITNFTDSVVTDANEIARLEKGQMRSNETIDRPVTITNPDTLKYLEDLEKQ